MEEDNHETAAKKRTVQENADDDMGVGGAAENDVQAELINFVAENELTLGNSLLSAYAPVIVAVCSNPGRFAEPSLKASAVLAFCKLMCTSSIFCEQNLQLLFTIIRDTQEPIIRANSIVALGDLAFRFPNLLEPWTPHFYARLRDVDTRVRKNTLMVLTHLILNDMVKVKGQISEMAICLEDEVSHISDLARLFFHELAAKGNTIYNILPDVISQLSDHSSGLKPDQFRSIMTYLFSFIQKDKQCESLIEKLCHRFRTTLELQQWRDFAHCLSLLQYSDKGVKKLTENFACFQDKLSDLDVYDSFQEIISKAKKFAKEEMKTALDELSLKISECHKKGEEDELSEQKAAKLKKKRNMSTYKARAAEAEAAAAAADKIAVDGEDAMSQVKETKSAKSKAATTKPTQKWKVAQGLKAKKSGRAAKIDSDSDVDALSLSEGEDDDVSTENADPVPNKAGKMPKKVVEAAGASKKVAAPVKRGKTDAPAAKAAKGRKVPVVYSDDE